VVYVCIENFAVFDDPVKSISISRLIDAFLIAKVSDSRGVVRLLTDTAKCWKVIFLFPLLYRVMQLVKILANSHRLLFTLPLRFALYAVCFIGGHLRLLGIVHCVKSKVEGIRRGFIDVWSEAVKPLLAML
jgi:hypothetical protein